MGTLIGGGSHAFDITYTSGHLITRCFAHHSDYKPDDDWVIIGINNPRVRAQVAEELGVYDMAWVHPYTYYGPDTLVGVGTHVNYGASLTRTTVGNHCTISPGVTICGDVVIGDRCLIGAGAVICDRVTIGDDCTIGAGAVVLPESVVPDGETWVGVPARCK